MVVTTPSCFVRVGVTLENRTTTANPMPRSMHAQILLEPDPSQRMIMGTDYDPPDAASMVYQVGAHDQAHSGKILNTLSRISETLLLLGRTEKALE